MNTVFKNVAFFLAILVIVSLQACGLAAKADANNSGNNRSAPVSAAVNPEHIMLTWQTDPAASQAVTWRTESPCANSFAQLAAASPDPGFGKNAVKVMSTDIPVKREDGSLVYYHTCAFQNLSPSTLYAYRVGSGDSFSEWNQFKTADTSPKPFKFIYFGDEQNDIKMYCSRVIRRAFSEAPDAAFIVHAGDLVGTADSDEQWSEWFDAAGWIFRTIPSIPVIGNHEQPDINPEDHGGFSRFWQPQFALPLNGPDDQKEIVYYLDYQGVRFIALNGTKLLEEQSKWLEPVLADNPNRWTIVVMHQPMFSSGKERDSLATQAAFENLYDKYKVDLVLQGHDHTYARTHKIYAGKIVANDKNGTIYCTSVAGPKQYPLNPRYAGLMSKTGFNAQLFQVISIDNDLLSYKSFTTTGTLFDAFEIKKTPDNSSNLIELVNR